MTTTTAPPMVRSVKDLIGYPIEETDGTIGKVKDFLFDDETHTIRYLVADTGNWLSSHLILISPQHLRDPDTGWTGKRFPVNLTKEEIENCPSLETDAPVSRQYEEAFTKYYSLNPYWTESAMIGYAAPPPSPRDLANNPNLTTGPVMSSVKGDSHLRSFNEVRGYDIKAIDGEIGHLEDFIVECDTLRLRFIIVNTHRWLPGGRVMFDIDWLEDFNYMERTAAIELTKDQIKGGPKYDPGEAVNEDSQRILYDYYGKPTPWEKPPITPF
ncbi:MAG: PRC-barrel domain-containing protein [Verrucomicrobiales bacterium]|nr:PRC-barrel domain-containing protein [Verrucomicrobiales bacterium]